MDGLYHVWVWLIQMHSIWWNFIKGADEALKIARMYNCTEAILKEGSPSCGSKQIYDGSFSGVKIDGMGITAEILKKEGLKILSEKDFEG